MRRPQTNRKAAKAVSTFRNLIAQGFTDEAMLIDAATAAIGSDDARKIAESAWAKHFKIMPAN